MEASCHYAIFSHMPNLRGDVACPLEQVVLGSMLNLSSGSCPFGTTLGDALNVTVLTF